MKKVLAWAVALALVLSSFTMAFADQAKTSADFKDASQIQYTEAVDVMVATGIINGYPDGTFGPQKTVKRSEMAKMIACIMNGGEDIGDQYKGACPFADSKDHWAAGYIAYCASEHIIDGRSADVFDPEAEVTGTEVAKMALTSLGYDSGIQGYTGENWAANVLKDAKKNDLFDGLASDFVPGDPCTREAAAQILFNMLKATEVEYDNATSVEVGDAKVTVNSKVQPVKDAQGNTVELYEDVFGGDLTKKDTTTAEGKPAHKWFYEKKEIGEYPDEADETAVVDESGKTAEDIVEDVDEDASVGTVTLNGDLQDQDAAAFQTLVGDKVEMFEDGEDEAGNAIYNLVVTRYELAKVGEVDTDVTEKDAKDDVTAYVTINDKSYKDTDVAGFDAATYEEDVYLAVAFNEAGDIMDSYVADTDQGVITKKTKDAITVNGTAATMNGNYAAGVNASTDSVAWGSLKVNDSTYDVYFDAEGYVLGAVVFEESEDVVGVFDGKKVDEDAYSGKPTTTVRILDEKAEATEYVTTAKAAGELPQESPALIKYELNDNNKVKAVEFEGEDFGSVSKDTEVTKRGIMGNQIIAEDVVAYFYSPEELDSEGEVKEEAEWIVYGYEDLLEATVASGTTFVLNSDGEVAYMLLSADVVDNSEETVLGFYVSADMEDNGDGAQYVVTALVDGSEQVITTAADCTFNGGIDELFTDDAMYPVLVKFVLNGDGEAKEVGAAYLDYDDEVSDDFGDYDGVRYYYSGIITKVSGKNLMFEESPYTYVGDATVLRIKINSDGEYDGLVKYSGKFAEGGYAMVVQLNEDSESWDTVVYITPNDMEAWQLPM